MKRRLIEIGAVMMGLVFINAAFVWVVQSRTAESSDASELLMGAGITAQYDISSIDIKEFYNKKGQHCMVAIRDGRPNTPLVLICQGY